MRGEEATLWGEEEGGVVVFVRGGFVLRDAAAEEIGFGFGG